MLNNIISFSLKHQWRVVAIFIAISGLGVWSFLTMRVDVLPDINKPTVAVFAEAEGLAPEEIERLVLAPVENAVAGAPGVTRVRARSRQLCRAPARRVPTPVPAAFRTVVSKPSAC